MLQRCPGLQISSCRWKNTVSLYCYLATRQVWISKPWLRDILTSIFHSLHQIDYVLPYIYIYSFFWTLSLLWHISKYTPLQKSAFLGLRWLIRWRHLQQPTLQDWNMSPTVSISQNSYTREHAKHFTMHVTAYLQMDTSSHTWSGLQQTWDCFLMLPVFT